MLISRILGGFYTTSVYPNKPWNSLVLLLFLLNINYDIHAFHGPIKAE